MDNKKLLQTDAVLVVKNGQLNTIEAPKTGYGKTVICWENGKPTRVEHQFSEKL